MNSIKNFFNSMYTPKESDFYTHGYLTPDQFLKAGDQLTKTGWKWNPSVTKKHAKVLTDPKKQFLTSNARSSQRIKEIMKGKTIEEETEGGWVQCNEIKDEISPQQQQSQQVEEKKQVEGQYRIYDLSITYDVKLSQTTTFFQGILSLPKIMNLRCF